MTTSSSYPTGEFSASQNSKSICPKHLAEWVEGSAVSEAIALLNINSLTAKELTERIRPKSPIKTGGWWCSGVNWRTGVKLGVGQAKPDEPHHPEGQKKAAKYLTPSGMEPDAIFLAMPDKDYWFKVRGNTSIPRHWTEGVKKAAAGLTIDLATIALTGVWNWSKDKQLAKDVELWAQPNTIHYIDFDSDYADNPSCRAAILEFGRLLEKHGCEVYVTVWDTKFKGMDDFIKNNGAEAFKEAVANAPSLKEWERQLKKNDRKNAVSTPNNSFSHPRTREEKSVVCQSYDSSAGDYIPETAPLADQNFVQKAELALYSDGRWVSIAGQLYRFTGSHYELQAQEKEERRIRQWLNTHIEKGQYGYSYKRAKSSNITEVFQWMARGVGVELSSINPGGLNCANGIVTINCDGSHTFTPHSPDRVYTYVGCKYDPDADPTDCDRFLKCLTPAYLDVFLRTAASGLAVELVRKTIGRKLKGLLCYGDGSNGKDTLRNALAEVFGRGMTGKTLSDFKSYDSGRKFTLAGIEESLCNWSSENASTVKLDSLQSLKQFITGDPIDIERKGKDSFPCNPKAIFLANCNKLPSITGGMEAITSRYSIIKFEKTFVVGADPSRGELEADPRFKDDPDFVREKIAPALLNKLLAILPKVLTEGIDHSVTREAMQEAQEESRHLWGFVREMGIEAQSGGRIYVKDLWEMLQRWYEETGILDVERNGEKVKLIWNDLTNEWDKPVKAVNQVHARFCELFPKLEKRRHTEGSDSDPLKGQRYLLGIGFQKSQESENIASRASLPCDDVEIASLAASRDAMSDAMSDAKILTLQSSDARDAISLTAAEILKIIHQLTDSEREKLAEALTGQDLYRPFKVGDRVAHVNPAEKSYNWHGRIVQITSSRSCMVDWDEREGMRGGRVISALFCNLRHI